MRKRQTDRSAVFTFTYSILPFNNANNGKEGRTMADYRRMYSTLCAGVSEVLDDMQGQPDLETFYLRLQDLLNQAEDIYIDTADEEE